MYEFHAIMQTELGCQSPQTILLCPEWKLIFRTSHIWLVCQKKYFFIPWHILQQQVLHNGVQILPLVPPLHLRKHCAMCMGKITKTALSQYSQCSKTKFLYNSHAMLRQPAAAEKRTYSTQQPLFLTTGELALLKSTNTN